MSPQTETSSKRRFQAALEYLASFTDWEQLLHQAPGRTTFDLGRLRRLLAALGNPQDHVPCVHVTGTKGKSSIVAMAECILRAHGLHTYRFLSPHVERVHERLALDGCPLDDATFASLVDRLKPHIARLRKDAPEDLPSFFEATTTMGFLLAEEAAVDISILEVGLGGRLDATNVVDPVISLIGSIARDHTRILGNSLAAIASEKAGIIKPGRPVATLVTPDSEAFEPIAQKARQTNSALDHPGAGLELLAVTRLRRAQGGPAIRFSGKVGRLILKDVELAAGAAHQAWNALLALRGAQAALKIRGLEPDIQLVRAALSKLQLPARSEWFQGPPPVLLDGAHTHESMVDLASTARFLAEGRPILLVCALTRDRDPVRVLGPLAKTSSLTWVTRLGTPRGSDPGDVAHRLEQAGLTALAEEEAPLALAKARQAALETGGLVVVAGSLYLAGALRQLVRHGLPSCP